MEGRRYSFWLITAKTIVVHTVTYFITGILALVFLDYANRFADPAVRVLMRQVGDPLVAAGPMLQPLRGILFGLVFYLLQREFFERDKGWLVMWLCLVFLGILSTFGPTPGSIEGLIYTNIPVGFQLLGLTEVILQALLLSVILFWWMKHPEKKWLNWVMGLAFGLVLLMSALGVVMG
jgi:hypothetical protein